MADFLGFMMYLGFWVFRVFLVFVVCYISSQYLVPRFGGQEQYIFLLGIGTALIGIAVFEVSSSVILWWLQRSPKEGG